MAAAENGRAVGRGGRQRGHATSYTAQRAKSATAGVRTPSIDRRSPPTTPPHPQPHPTPLPKHCCQCCECGCLPVPAFGCGQICGAPSGIARLHTSDVTVGGGACDTCGNGTCSKSPVLPKVSCGVLSCASSAIAIFYITWSNVTVDREEDETAVYSLFVAGRHEWTDIRRRERCSVLYSSTSQRSKQRTLWRRRAGTGTTSSHQFQSQRWNSECSVAHEP